jgi:hypothetical protein
MNDSLFESIEQSCRILRLDFSSAEFASLAEELEFSEEAATAVKLVFKHLQEKKATDDCPHPFEVKPVTPKRILRLSRILIFLSSVAKMPTG